MEDRRIVIFRDSEEEARYINNHVATPSFVDRKVIRDKKGIPIADKSAAVVIKKAKKMGHKDPVLIPFFDDEHIKRSMAIARSLNRRRKDNGI